VTGVKAWEILLTHILTQITITIAHNIVVISSCFYVWGLQCKGSLYIVILFTFLIAVCGMMYGMYPLHNVWEEIVTDNDITFC